VGRRHCTLPGKSFQLDLKSTPHPSLGFFGQRLARVTTGNLERGLVFRAQFEYKGDLRVDNYQSPGEIASLLGLDNPKNLETMRRTLSHSMQARGIGSS